MSRRFLEILVLAILLTIVLGLLTHYWTSIPFQETTQVIIQRFNRALFLLLIVVPLFALLERFWPSIANQPKLRPGVWTDLVYWFFTPMVIQTMSIISIVLFLLPVYLFIGRISIDHGTLILDWSKILTGYGIVSHWPIWVQGAIAIVLGDFLGYWTHRMNHSRLLWDYHAVHHSGEIIDWLSAVRLHPVNDMLARVITASPIMLVGFSPIAVEAYVPFLSAYIALIHANVAWDYGAFRYVIASPVFHRWHHTTDEAGLGKNFSGLFPIFDVIFGTFTCLVNNNRAILAFLKQCRIHCGDNWRIRFGAGSCFVSPIAIAPFRRFSELALSKIVNDNFLRGDRAKLAQYELFS